MPKDTQSGGGRDKAVSDEELWRRITAEVKPLRSRGKAQPPGEASRQTEKRTTPVPVPGIRPVMPPVRKKAPEAPELTHGMASGVDKRTLAKLRRGQIAIEAEIDLHGSTQDQAHRTLEAFLARSQAAGRRCVLVITGKGFRTDGTGGVLRNAVPRWMNESPNRERILAFSHAIPPDGGEGALYVLLRRTRRPGGRALRE